jgi:hypothetical protein
MSLAGLLPSFLFWFPVIVLMLVSVFFLRYRVYRELPLFFLYILSAPGVGLLRYVTFRISTSAYFYLYWICELELAVVFSLAIYEMFLRRLFPRFHKVRLYRLLFPAVAGIILLLTIIAALESPNQHAAFQLASRVFDFLRTAFLVFFMFLMLLMGRQWSRYDLGITLGFGLQAAAALANAAVRGKLGHRSQIFDNAEIMAFEVACVIWLITFLKPEPSGALQPAAPLDPSVLPHARKWEEVLKDWLTPGKRMM